MREGHLRLDRGRSQDGQDLAREETVQERALLGGEVFVTDELDSVLLEIRQDFALVGGIGDAHHAVGTLPDLGQHRGNRLLPLRAVEACLHGFAQARDAHHEELVEIGEEDPQKAQTLERGEGRILGFLEDAPVEAKPGEGPAEIARLGGRAVAPAPVRHAVTSRSTGFSPNTSSKRLPF